MSSKQKITMQTSHSATHTPFNIMGKINYHQFQVLEVSSFSGRRSSGIMDNSILCVQVLCRAPLHKECPQHHGHKEDPGVTPRICGAIGERAQVILVWVRAPSVGNAFHLQRLGVTQVRP